MGLNLRSITIRLNYSLVASCITLSGALVIVERIFGLGRCQQLVFLFFLFVFIRKLSMNLPVRYHLRKRYFPFSSNRTEPTFGNDWANFSFSFCREKMGTLQAFGV
jgi:hypothetical protein